MSIDTKRIQELKAKILSKTSIPETEEATKQWYVMPLLVALGYDPYSSDIIPEFTLDVGVKSGEKVDYALQINNQPVALVECKQFNTQLSNKHVSQLYRYFTITDCHIAILTNGDDYWFFTDSKKANIMDLEPYYRLKLSEATNKDIGNLEAYSKESIHKADISKFVQYERFQTECRELIKGLKTNSIPSWLINTLAERSGMQEIDRVRLAECLYNEVKSQFLQSTKLDKASNAQGKSLADGKGNKSNIKLHHYYVFNDYSDGDWKFHKLDKALIFGTEYYNLNGTSLLITFITQLFETGKIDRESILEEPQFNKNYAINDKPDGIRAVKCIGKYNVYVETALSMGSIVRFIEKLCDYAHIRYDEIKLSFRE